MSSFRKLVRSTLIAVYVLILVGGVVRSSGSGMGCPDWPKCFGQWMPPASVEELPENYKEVYSEYRHKKNQRFAQYLSAFGFKDTAEKILNDESIKEEAEFNPVKTWIEYLNRVVGVIIGFMIFMVFIYSLQYRVTKKSLTVLSFLSFVLVGFQGWIGSFVVSTNLTPWTITLHMFLAMLLVAMLIYLMHISGEDGIQTVKVRNSFLTKTLLLFCAIVLLVQVLFGTQVREGIDLVASRIQDRENWISALGFEFILHRSFSWVVLIFHVILVMKLWKMSGVNRFALIVILLILGTILTGIGMAWFAIPPFLQPVHLLLATITFGAQFWLMLQVNKAYQTLI
ncbi:MAG TPA: COX15/CtaA family protein [Cyclobacteriaceae bacterium]